MRIRIQIPILVAMLAAEVAGGAAAPTAVDTTTSAPAARVPAREPWERVVGLPGDVVYAPFGVLFAGVESFLAYQERTRFLQRVRERLQFDEGRRALLPGVDSRAGLGLAYVDREWTSRLPRLQVVAMGGFRRRHGVVIAAAGDRVRLAAEVRRRPDEGFWGLGPRTRDADEARYERRLVTAGVDVVLPAVLGARLVGRLGAELDELADGHADDHPAISERFTPAQAPGLGGDEWFGVAALTVLADRRDRPGAPRGGSLTRLSGALFRELSRGSFDFLRFTGEHIRYRQLWPGRVLVGRLGVAAAVPVGGGGVPFYHLAEIGDEATTMRGFDRGRYRDRRSVYGGLEYRWPVWRVIDGLAFADAGQVARNLPGDLDFDRLRHSVGLGLRLWRDAGVVTRMMVSRSEAGTLAQAFVGSSF